MNLLIELKKASNFHTLERRILNKTKNSDSGCIEYQGTKDSSGYSSISVSFNGSQKKLGGHRLMFMIRNGDIPSGLVVMHSCDNPCCVNIDHLSVGTVKENVHDSISKGRFLSPKREFSKRPPIIKFSSDKKIRRVEGTRKIAKNQGEKFYLGSYHSCGNNIRYTHNGECKSCCNTRRRKAS